MPGGVVPGGSAGGVMLGGRTYRNGVEVSHFHPVPAETFPLETFPLETFPQRPLELVGRSHTQRRLRV